MEAKPQTAKSTSKRPIPGFFLKRLGTGPYTPRTRSGRRLLSRQRFSTLRKAPDIWCLPRKSLERFFVDDRGIFLYCRSFTTASTGIIRLHTYPKERLCSQTCYLLSTEFLECTSHACIFSEEKQLKQSFSTPNGRAVIDGTPLYPQASPELFPSNQAVFP